MTSAVTLTMTAFLWIAPLRIDTLVANEGIFSFGGSDHDYNIANAFTIIQVNSGGNRLNFVSLHYSVDIKVPFVAANTWSMASASMDSTGKLYTAGGTPATDAGSTLNMTPSHFCLGTRWLSGNPDASYAGDITIPEFVILSAISTADHNTIGNDMATRFGLSWTTVT